MAEGLTQAEILEVVWAKGGECEEECQRLKKMAKALGLDPVRFSASPPENLKDFQNKYKHNFWNDVSPGDGGEANQLPVCVGESSGQLLHKMLHLLFKQKISPVTLTAKLEHCADDLVKTGISPAQFFLAWNGRKQCGHRVHNDHKSDYYMLSVDYAVISDFEEAIQAFRGLWAGGIPVPALLVATEGEETHAMMAESLDPETKEFSCLDYRKAEQSAIIVGRDKFRQLVVVKPILDETGLKPQQKLNDTIDLVLRQANAKYDEEEAVPGDMAAPSDPLAEAVPGDMAAPSDPLAEVVDIDFDAEKEEQVNGGTVLHWAAANGQVEAVKAIISTGADMEALNKYKWTPLHMAANDGHVGAIEALIDARADTAAQDDDQQTPLHWAAANGHVGAINELISKDADKEARNRWLETPLHLAAIGDKHDAIQALAKAQADLSAQNNDEQTPLALAKGCKRENAIKILESLGAPE